MVPETENVDTAGVGAGAGVGVGVVGVDGAVGVVATSSPSPHAENVNIRHRQRPHNTLRRNPGINTSGNSNNKTVGMTATVCHVAADTRRQ